jgi:hypothetical protein
VPTSALTSVVAEVSAEAAARVAVTREKGGVPGADYQELHSVLRVDDAGQHTGREREGCQ